MHNAISFKDPSSLLNERRDVIEAVMAQYLASAHQGSATDEERSAAHHLVGLLIARLDGETSRLPLDPMSVRRHASRFGDGLVPILKDVFGTEVDDAFFVRCGDCYWKAVLAEYFH